MPPELDQRPWRRFFAKPNVSGQRRVAHLHLIASGDQRWADQLTFRDTLRRHAWLAAEYEQGKRRLANQHGHDREAYSEAKPSWSRACSGMLATIPERERAGSLTGLTSYAVG